MNEKKSRIQKRADYEIGVVCACKTKYDDKIAVLKRERDATMAESDVLKERLREKSDIEEKRDIAREIQQKLGDVKKKVQLIESFRNTSTVLSDLISLLRSFYDQELFKYIVDNIPEKKLPKMVRNPKKVDKVYDLSTKLLKDFNEQMQRILLASQNAQKQRSHLENNDEIIREQIGTDVADIDKLIAQIESEGLESDINVVSYDDNDMKKKS